MSRRCRLPELVDRQKERLRIKFGIEIRKEELDKKKKEMKWMNEGLIYERLCSGLFFTARGALDTLRAPPLASVELLVLFLQKYTCISIR